MQALLTRAKVVVTSAVPLVELFGGHMLKPGKMRDFEGILEAELVAGRTVTVGKDFQMKSEDLRSKNTAASHLGTELEVYTGERRLGQRFVIGAEIGTCKGFVGWDDKNHVLFMFYGKVKTRTAPFSLF